ncbi:MAG: hypothetical protein R2795_17065 [Saprospiraceae bacterium]
MGVAALVIVGIIVLIAGLRSWLRPTMEKEAFRIAAPKRRIGKQHHRYRADYSRL